METGFRPADGARRLLVGTQPIVSLALVECGLDITARAGVDALRRKSLALGDLFLALVAERCPATRWAWSPRASLPGGAARSPWSTRKGSR